MKREKPSERIVNKKFTPLALFIDFIFVFCLPSPFGSER